MAEVYRAYDQGLGRWRAIKIMLPEYVRKRKLRARFETEAKAMALLDHRNIVRVYDVGQYEGAPFIVMELCPGGSLEAWLLDQGPFSPRLAVDCIQQVCAGIQEAHDNGVIHRDIKSQNILVGTDGACKITDFGIAQTELTNFTNTGSAMGTLGFMAPEQRSDAKKVDHRSDVYSIGATLYNLLTGKVPTHLFAADQDDEILAGLDPDMLAIIKRATEYNRDRRFQSVSELAHALQDLMPSSDHGLSALRGDYTPPPVPRVRRPTPEGAEQREAEPVEPRPLTDHAAPASQHDYVISVPPQHVRASDPENEAVGDALSRFPPIGAHQPPPPPGRTTGSAEQSTGVPAQHRHPSDATVPPRRREVSGLIETPSQQSFAREEPDPLPPSGMQPVPREEEDSSLIAELLDTLVGPGLYLAIPLFLVLLGAVAYYSWSSSQLATAETAYASASTTFITSIDRSDEVIDSLVNLGGDESVLTSHERDFDAATSDEGRIDAGERLLRTARSEFARLPPPEASDPYSVREHRKVQMGLERLGQYQDTLDDAERTLRSRSSGLFGPL